jgi:predicted methyltransferase MtxX (methanogen marker protein 4)
MKFPELSRQGTDAHASAVRRRDAARSEQHLRREVLAAVRGTDEERSATSELAAASQELAAREAWVSWVERGY